MVSNGVFAVLASLGPKKAVTMFNPAQRHSFDQHAQEYKKFAVKRRDSKYLSSTLTEAKPMLEIEQRLFGVNEFLLNTPTDTFDLRVGKSQDYNSEDCITKQTECDPSDANQQI